MYHFSSLVLLPSLTSKPNLTIAEIYHLRELLVQESEAHSLVVIVTLTCCISIRVPTSLTGSDMLEWPVCRPTHAQVHVELSCNSCTSTDLHLVTTQYLFTAGKMLPLSNTLTFGIRDFLKSCAIICSFSITSKGKLKKLFCYT